MYSIVFILSVLYSLYISYFKNRWIIIFVIVQELLHPVFIQAEHHSIQAEHLSIQADPVIQALHHIQEYQGIHPEPHIQEQQRTVHRLTETLVKALCLADIVSMERRLALARSPFRTKLLD